MKTPVATLALALAMCGMLVSLCLADAPSVPTAAEEAGWEMDFTDNFDRDELGDNWEVLAGDWALEDGALVGKGTLIATRAFPAPEEFRDLPGESAPGFLRVEFEVRTERVPGILLPGAPPPKGSPTDVNAFIHAPPLEAGARPALKGYYFQFGAFMNSRNIIRRAGVLMAEDTDPEMRIKPGETHRIVMENDEGTVRLIVDGRVLLESDERASLVGHGYDRVGFDFHTRVWVRNLRIYAKRLPEGYI